MKFIKQGFVWDTEKSEVIGSTGWIDAWYTDYKGEKEELKIFYKTPKGRYFSVESNRKSSGGCWDFLSRNSGNNASEPNIRIYEDAAECADWFDAYGLIFPEKLPEA